MSEQPFRRTGRVLWWAGLALLGAATMVAFGGRFLRSPLLLGSTVIQLSTVLIWLLSAGWLLWFACALIWALHAPEGLGLARDTGWRRRLRRWVIGVTVAVAVPASGLTVLLGIPDFADDYTLLNPEGPGGCRLVFVDNGWTVAEISGEILICRPGSMSLHRTGISWWDDGPGSVHPFDGAWTLTWEDDVAHLKIGGETHGVECTPTEHHGSPPRVRVETRP